METPKGIPEREALINIRAGTEGFCLFLTTGLAEVGGHTVKGCKRQDEVLKFSSVIRSFIQIIKLNHYYDKCKRTISFTFFNGYNY